MIYFKAAASLYVCLTSHVTFLPVEFSPDGDFSVGEKKRVHTACFRSKTKVEARDFFVDTFGTENTDREFLKALDVSAPAKCFNKNSLVELSDSD